MNGHSLGAAVRRLRESLGGPAGSDAALLARFAADRDPAAFAGLVARYGPLVLGVCRRVVDDPHIAEDLFQAAFMVLARKAGSIRNQDAVGSWLFGVAYRLARKAQRRLSRVVVAPFGPESRDDLVGLSQSRSADPAATAAWNDLVAALDAELQHLPDRLRAPLLLCYYDGCTRDEAARRLGWSFGTLRRRLEQGRALLRVRLTARGATLGAGLMATVLATRGARASVSVSLTRTTINAAETFADGGRLATTAAQLAEEGLQMFGASKLRASVALIVLVCGLAAGTGVLFGVGRDQPGSPTPPPAAKADVSLPGEFVLRHGGAPFRHGTKILNVLVSPDGKTIYTQGLRSVRFWDAVGGQEQGMLELGDDGADFWTSSLTPDGKTLLTTRHNGTAQVWNIATRKLTRSFALAAPPFDVSGAKCVHSPNGKAIAVVTSDGSIRVCDVTAGKEMEHLRSHSDSVSAAVFHPDNKWLVLSTGDLIKAWDLATGFENSPKILPMARNLAFSSDGRRLVGANHVPAGEGNKPAETATVWTVNWNSGKSPRQLGGNSLADVLMTLTPDGNYLLAPDRRSGGTILTQWDLLSGRAMRQYPAHDKPIQALAFTPDGKTLITADTGLRFWDWTTGAERRPASDGRFSYALSSDGKTVVECSKTGAMRLWDSNSGAELRRFEVLPPSPESEVQVNEVAISPDSKFLAAKGMVLNDKSQLEGSGWHFGIWVWDLAANKLLHQLKFPSQQWANSIAFSPDSRMLTSVAGSRAHLWDLATGQDVSDRLAQDRSVAEATFTADGKGVVTWSGQTEVVVFPIPAARISGFSVASGGRVEGWDNFVLSQDRSRLAVSASGYTSPGEVWVYDIAKGKAVGHISNLSRPPSRFALSMNGSMLAVGSDAENAPILVFDVATGRELKRFNGLHGQAAWLAFIPDGKQLCAASTDSTVLAWELP
jgi:RNA polymerase sigma factor (sigma-70 family)